MGNDWEESTVVRWVAYGISLVASAVMLFMCFAMPPWGSRTSAATPRVHAAAATQTAPKGAALATTTPPRSVVVSAPNAPAPPPPPPAAPAGVDAPPAAIQPQFELPPGVAPEQGLQINTIWVARAISALFPQLTTIGGYRQDRLPWHPNGLAIDVMIPNHNSPEGIRLGNMVAALAMAHSKQWGVIHAIWRQVIYPGVGAPSWMADYGNETLNHYDHVHIATIGGGYPPGPMQYFFGVMGLAPPR